MASGSGTELEKLLNSLHFENQQYLNEIEKEHQTIAKLQEEIQQLNSETQHLNDLKTQLDEDCKHFHKQFVQNRDILESQKSTLRMMEEHEEASRLKLQRVIEEGLRIRQEEQEQLTHYQNIADSYRTKYESFPYVQKLRHEEEQLRQSQVQLQEEEKKLKALKFKIEQIKQAKGKKAPVPLNEWIVKLAEVYVRTTRTKREIQKKEQSLQNLKQRAQERRQQIALEKQRKEEELRQQREAEAQRERELRNAEALRAQEEALHRAEELHRKLVAGEDQEAVEKTGGSPVHQQQQQQQQQQRTQKQQGGQGIAVTSNVTSLPASQPQIQMPVIRTPQIGIPRLTIPQLSVPPRQPPRSFPAMVMSHTPYTAPSIRMPTQVAPPQLRNLLQRQPSYIPVTTSSPRPPARSTDQADCVEERVVSEASPAQRSFSENVASPAKSHKTPDRPAADSDGDTVMRDASPGASDAKQSQNTPKSNRALTPKTPDGRQLPSDLESASAKFKALMSKSPSDGFTYRPAPARNQQQSERQQEEYSKKETTVNDDFMKTSPFFTSVQSQQGDISDGAGDPGNGIVDNQANVGDEKMPNSAGGDSNNFSMFGGVEYTRSNTAKMFDLGRGTRPAIPEMFDFHFASPHIPHGQPFTFDFGSGPSAPSGSGDNEMFNLFGGSDNSPPKPSGKDNFSFDFGFGDPTSPSAEQGNTGFKLF